MGRRSRLPIRRLGRSRAGRFLRAAGLAVVLLVGALPLAPRAGAQEQAELDEAILSTRMRLESDPGDRELRLRLVGLYLAQGTRQLKAGDRAAALSSLSQGLRVAEASGGQIASSDEVMRLMDQTLARAARELGNDRERIATLERLVASSTGFTSTRYVLGTALMRSKDPAEFARGMDVMTALHGEDDSELRRRVAAAGAGLAYERALAEFRDGRPGGAQDTLRAARERFGERPFQTEAQNQNLRYTFAKALDDTGETEAALREYEALYAENPGYALAGGAALRGILADTYYKRAVELLASEGAGVGDEALGLLDRLEALEGSGSVDLHHARYLAHHKLGDEAAAERERKTIRELDPAYHDALFPAH
jgi:hypothetical protein